MPIPRKGGPSSNKSRGEVERRERKGSEKISIKGGRREATASSTKEFSWTKRKRYTEHPRKRPYFLRGGREQSSGGKEKGGREKKGQGVTMRGNSEEGNFKERLTLGDHVAKGRDRYALAFREKKKGHTRRPHDKRECGAPQPAGERAPIITLRKRGRTATTANFPCKERKCTPFRKRRGGERWNPEVERENVIKVNNKNPLLPGTRPYGERNVSKLLGKGG